MNTQQKLKPKDLGGEEIKIKLSKNAFGGPLHCPQYNIPIKK